MTTSSITTRLKFLADSAHALSTNAPSTSAYLMSQYNRLMFENGLDQSDSCRRHVCSACGNLMILGWAGTMRLENNKATKKWNNDRSKTDRAKSKPPKTIIYSCESCGRQSRQSINTEPHRSLKRSSHGSSLISKHVDSTISSQTYSTSKTASSSAANASSRKRAKARKLGSLQALLAKHKESATQPSTGGFGLDLLDLMKTA